MSNIELEKERSKRKAREHRIAKWGIEFADVSIRGKFGHAKGSKAPNVILDNQDGSSNIILSQGKCTIVDSDDVDKISGFRWIACKDTHTFYVRTQVLLDDGRRYTASLHRVITDAPKNLQVDHFDGNGLNNRRSNLRLVTPRVNNQNRHSPSSSRFIGVGWSKSHGLWRSRIEIDGKEKLLGWFSSEIEAARAYEDACLLYGFDLPLVNTMQDGLVNLQASEVKEEPGC